MKNLALLFAFIILSAQTSSGQSGKTIYYDLDWEEVKSVESASYYRVVDREGDHFLVTDFFMNNTVQMTGSYADKACTEKDGIFSYFDSSGVIEKTVSYRHGKLDGETNYFFQNGNLKEKIVYQSGARNGIYQELHSSGKLRAEANYVDGKIVGDAKRYYPDGSLRLTINIDDNGDGEVIGYFVDGSIQYQAELEGGGRSSDWVFFNQKGEKIESVLYSKIENQEDAEKSRYPSDRSYNLYNLFFAGFSYIQSDGGIIDFPDIDAEFPGGSIAMQKFIASNVNYPSKARNKGIQGLIYVSFIVNIDGSISDIKAMRGPNLLREESIRVVERMPNWYPAEANGVEVRTRCSLPIRYVLDK